MNGPIVGSGVDAVGRTHGCAHGVAAAGLGDHERHQRSRVVSEAGAADTGTPLKKAFPDGRSI